MISRTTVIGAAQALLDQANALPADPVIVPPAVVFEPAITGDAQPEQYCTWDGGSGPSFAWWNTQLGIKWRNQTVGDFTDANGVAQGTAPFATTAIPVVGYQPFDVTVLVKRALVANKGFYLRVAGTDTGNIVIISGRTTLRPPTLSVTTDAGQFDCPCLSNAAWEPQKATTVAINSRAGFTLSTTWLAIVRFDLSSVRGAVASSVMKLDVNKVYGHPSIQVFEADPPTFQVGAGAMTPVIGLAAEVGEANLASHPDVYMAGDFTGTTIDFANQVANTPKLFGRINVKSAAPEILPDPDAPGTFMWRGSFVPLIDGQDPRRQAFDGTKMLMRPDLNDPLRPSANVVDEAHYRVYLELEDDFLNTHDGAKIGITWDLRMGYWVDVADLPGGGYWQNTTGNGGLRGDGKRHRRIVTGVGDRYVYNGHMERMECGIQPTDGSPYALLKPLTGYNYHVDQGGPYPGGWPVTNDELGGPVYGNVVPIKFGLGRKICVEQRLRMNTIDLSVLDADGNGVGRHDGLIETWTNGIFADRRVGYCWRHHPQMGIAQVNANTYLGGREINDKVMHYDLNFPVVAKRYIGPRVAP